MIVLVLWIIKELYSCLLDPSPDNKPEENVGITQFLSDHDGFDGIIKYR